MQVVNRVYLSNKKRVGLYRPFLIVMLVSLAYLFALELIELLYTLLQYFTPVNNSIVTSKLAEGCGAIYV